MPSMLLRFSVIPCFYWTDTFCPSRRFQQPIMGILQILSLRYGSLLNVSEFRYMRTPSKKTVSAATMMQYLRQHIFCFMAETPHLGITQIILEKQKRVEIIRTYGFLSRINFSLSSKVEMPKVTPHVCSIPFAPIWQSRV